MIGETAVVTVMIALAAQAASAAEPVRIGVGAPLSGLFADHGQSERYGAELALQGINQAGGALATPVTHAIMPAVKGLQVPPIVDISAGQGFVKRAGSDTPTDLRIALTKTAMPSLLGGSHATDDRNHPHAPMQMVGARDGKVVAIGAAG